MFNFGLGFRDSVGQICIASSPGDYLAKHSYSFDGASDAVPFANTGLPTGDASRSIALWFRAHTLTDEQTIIGWGISSTNSQFCLSFKAAAQANKITVWGPNNDVTGTKVLARDTWYHLVVTYDSATSSLKSYVDNVIDIDGSPMDYETSAAGNFNIGNGLDIGQKFHGYITNASIYDRALTAVEVAELYVNGTIKSGRVFWAKCAEGSGTVCIDEHGNNGTITTDDVATFHSLIAPTVPDRSYLFAGDNDVINCGAILNYTSSDFSYSFWVKPTATGSIDYLFHNGIWNNRGHGLCFNTRRIVLETNQSGGTQSTWSNHLLTAGVWQHIVVTRAGASVKIYLNNAEVAYSVVGVHVDPRTTPDDFLVGAYPGGTNVYTGGLTRFCSFSKVLTAAERTTLYLKGWVTDSLELSYKCNEESGVAAIDDSGYARNGVLTNIVEATFHSEDIPTIADGSYLFAGDNDQINCGGILNYTSSDFSFSFWVKPTTTDYTDTIFYKGLFGGNGYYAKFNGKLIDFYTNQWHVYQRTCSNDLLVAGVWQHIIITRSGASVKIYRNNIETSYLDVQSHVDPLSSGNAFLIGTYNATNGFYAGGLTRFCSFSKELTAEERMTLYNKGWATDSLELLYKCSEGSGIAAVDDSGNARNGVLTNIVESTFHSDDVPA